MFPIDLGESLAGREEMSNYQDTPWPARIRQVLDFARIQWPLSNREYPFQERPALISLFIDCRHESPRLLTPAGDNDGGHCCCVHSSSHVFGSE